jgi:threonine dehydrogenase-like Zn-dependent dehydrogenase
MNGASSVLRIATNWKINYVKERYPKAEFLYYSTLLRRITVTWRRKKIAPHGLNIALECIDGEYGKGWASYFELRLGMETDTSEIVNEMITSMKNFGRCGVTGIYVGSVSFSTKPGPRPDWHPQESKTNHFDLGLLMERGIRLIGNGQAPAHMYWETLCGMADKGEIDPLKIMSHRAKMEELDEVYYRFESKENGMQKVFVQIGFSASLATERPSLTTYKQ